MGIADHVRDNWEHARWVFGVMAIILAPLALLKIGGLLFEWLEMRDGRKPEQGAPTDYPLGRWDGSQPWF